MHRCCISARIDVMRKNRPENRINRPVVLFAAGLLFFAVLLSWLLLGGRETAGEIPSLTGGISSLNGVPAYSGSPSVILNANRPAFDKKNLTVQPFELYSELDSLGRCGPASANICPELMPDEPRGAIGAVRPSGWQTVRYDDLVEGKYLYNRCHLIGYQLAGENANVRNLITGTRYMNISGMLPYENRVESYVRKTGNHVLYRSTPVFEGSDLVAAGIQLEALSVEDRGEGICFNVFVYNVQPGIVIDYATGDSHAVLTETTEAPGAPVAPVPADRAESSADAENSKLNGGSRNGREAPSGSEIPAAPVAAGASTAPAPAGSAESPAVSKLPAENVPASSEIPAPAYIFNTHTKKFHYPSCRSVGDMSEKNRQEFYGTRQEAVDEGYSPCGICKP